MLELPLPDNLLSPLIQSKLMPRFPRSLTSAALDDKTAHGLYKCRSSVRLRLAGCRGVEDRTIMMVHMVMMLFVFVLSASFSLYTVYSSASLVLASDLFHAFFRIGLAYTLSFPNLVAL
jgi:hypothetical protein